jgi:hypothetical protein
VVSQLHQLLAEDKEIRTAAMRHPGVILFRGSNDDINHIGETTATLPAFFQRAVDLDRNDQLPAIFIEKAFDCLDDFSFGDDVAMTGDHWSARGSLLATSGRNMVRMDGLVNEEIQFRQ